MPLYARVVLRKKTHVSGRSYYYIHIPSKVGSDSQFIFREGDAFKMVVEPSKKRLVLSKISGREKKSGRR
ncbi:hypothetical protein HRbin01_00831 [archaeon HR01]|nr:hypothetical protein HRbin01_00831 [archaeon HR01]